MKISWHGRVVLGVVLATGLLLSGTLFAKDDENTEKNKSAKVVDIGLAKDPIALLEILEKRRADLDEREKWLEVREADLKRLEEKLGKRITALEQLRDAIRADVAQEKDQDDANIKRLAKIYAGMKPKAAASSLMAMDRETAVKALRAVPEKVAAKILSKMDVKEAVQISEALGMPIAQKRANPDTP
ncbi:MAG: hypothetical protein HQM03_10635 [Magnetococcales bacterium]|nr:hypothetical protein [Magnetococcales bacterium]